MRLGSGPCPALICNWRDNAGAMSLDIYCAGSTPWSWNWRITCCMEVSYAACLRPAKSVVACCVVCCRLCLCSVRCSLLLSLALIDLFVQLLNRALAVRIVVWRVWIILLNEGLAAHRISEHSRRQRLIRRATASTLATIQCHRDSRADHRVRTSLPRISVDHTIPCET